MDHVMVNQATAREFMFCTWPQIRMERLFLQLIKKKLTSLDKFLPLTYFVHPTKISEKILHTNMFCLKSSPLPPLQRGGEETMLTAKKIKILKKWKKCMEISSFYTCVPKIMVRWHTIPEIWCATGRWTDRWKKWHIEVGAPPKNTHH